MATDVWNGHTTSSCGLRPRWRTRYSSNIRTVLCEVQFWHCWKKNVGCSSVMGPKSAQDVRQHCRSCNYLFRAKNTSSRWSIRCSQKNWIVRRNSNWRTKVRKEHWKKHVTIYTLIETIRMRSYRQNWIVPNQVHKWTIIVYGHVNC